MSTENGWSEENIQFVKKCIKKGGGCIIFGGDIYDGHQHFETNVLVSTNDLGAKERERLEQQFSITYSGKILASVNEIKVDIFFESIRGLVKVINYIAEIFPQGDE